MILPDNIQPKLREILRKKNARGGTFCLPFEPEAMPINVRKIFPDYESYTLEIGCGWGEFTRAAAAAAPKTLHVAVEKKLARVLSSGRTQQAEGIGNVRYLILDIAWFFDGIFADDTFDEITVNFPDPWPKLRHHKHRFVSPDFAAVLTRIARRHSRFTFATDNYLYAREAAETFENTQGWRNTEGRYIARRNIPGRPVSFFEGIHRGEGAPIYFFVYEKI